MMGIGRFSSTNYRFYEHASSYDITLSTVPGDQFDNKLQIGIPYSGTAPANCYIRHLKILNTITSNPSYLSFQKYAPVFANKDILYYYPLDDPNELSLFRELKSLQSTD